MADQGVDLDGNGAKDLVIIDTESDHPIHVRFATDEKKLGPNSGLPFRCLERSRLARSMAGGSEILVVEGASGRAKALTLDKSSGDEATNAAPCIFRVSPGKQRADRWRSATWMAYHKDVMVTDPANAKVWAYLQTGLGLEHGSIFRQPR